MKGDNYKAWEINEKNFPKEGSMEEKIQYLTGYGILAPSTHNTQPWLFNVDSSNLKIELNSSIYLKEADRSGRNALISLGACTFNIIVAAEHFGLEPHITFKGTDINNVAIHVDFKTSPKVISKYAKLFPYITKRYTEKRVLPDQTIETHILDDFMKLSDESSMVLLTKDKQVISKLAHDCYIAAASYANTPLFAKELSGWLRTNNTKSYDGMPGRSSGLNAAKAIVGKAVMHILPKSLKVMAKKYLKMIQTSPAVGIISTPEDSVKDWFHAGFKFEWLSLLATSHGISLSPMASLIERPGKSKLVESFNKSEGYPQMFYRLINATRPIHTPRRAYSRISSEKVLIDYFNTLNISVELKQVEVLGHIINYVEAGNGPNLLMIHGANLGWGQWYPNIGSLAKDFHIIALDLPGCGGSTPISFRNVDFENNFLSIVTEFIQKLDLNNLTIIGHSFGGALALGLATNKKLSIEKLILLSPLGFTRQVPNRQKLATLYPVAKILSRTALKPTRSNMAKFLDGPLKNRSVVSSELVDYYWTAIMENDKNHPILFMNGLTKPLFIKRELLLVDQLAKIDQSTLIIAGDNDPLTPIKKIRTTIKSFTNFKLVIYEDTGHVPSLERSDRFNDEVRGFLN